MTDESASSCYRPVEVQICGHTDFHPAVRFDPTDHGKRQIPVWVVQFQRPGVPAEVMLLPATAISVVREVSKKKDPVPPKDDSFEEALRRACEEPTLAEALTWLAIWDCDRAVHQALRNDAARREHREHPATSHGGLYETTFLICFKRLLERWDSSV